jgi:hypothetical protein
MRVNVYSEELTDDVRLIEKRDIVGEDGDLVTFHGIRLFLESSDKMHTTPTDDDRSAVTFWFRESEAERMYALFRRAASTATLVAVAHKARP